MANYRCKNCDVKLSDDHTDLENKEFECKNCNVVDPYKRCDCCKAALEENEGFWVDGDVDTKNQKKVAQKMTTKKEDVICDSCFEEYVES